jgi:DNA-binding NtrC family response regulator
VKNLKVLLVDDEEELVVTMVERLELRGITAKAVTRGSDALTALESEPFDVVVLDLLMPGIGGLKMKSIIERDHPSTEVLLVTGHGSQSPEKDVPSDLHVLMKPFSIDTLVQAIREVLGGKEVV